MVALIVKWLQLYGAGLLLDSVLQSEKKIQWKVQMLAIPAFKMRNLQQPYSSLP